MSAQESSLRKLLRCKAFGYNKIQQFFSCATIKSTLSILTSVSCSAVKYMKTKKIMFSHLSSTGHSQASSGSHVSFLLTESRRP